MKINLYFSPSGRACAITAMRCEIAQQCEMGARLAEDETRIADSAALSRQLGMFSLTFGEDDGTLKSFCLDTDKRDKRLRTSGYFASKTIGLDMTPLEAMDNYSMRDEQEKCFQLRKSPMNQDRTRCWSESSKHGQAFSAS